MAQETSEPSSHRPLVEAAGRARRPHVQQWGGYALAALAAWSVFAAGVVFWHERIGEQEATRLLTQVRVVETNLAHQLAATDSLLRRLAADAARGQAAGAAADGVRLFQNYSDAMPGVRTLVLVDARGRVRLSNREQLIGLDVSGRDYFRNAMQESGDRLLVTPPFMSPLKAYVINLLRVVRNRDGGFGGLVVAALDPAYFSILLNSVNYASDMRCAVVHGDGTLFMVAPEGAAGQDPEQPGALFSRHRASGQRESVLTGAPTASEKPRMAALLTFQPAALGMDKPLLIGASRDLDAVYADWQRVSLSGAGVLLAGMAIVAIGLALFQRRQRRLEENFRVVVEAAPYGIALLEADGRVAHLNPAFTRLFGYTLAEVPTIGHWWPLAYPDPEYRAGVMAQWDALAGGADPAQQSRVFRVRGADGADRDVQFVAVTLGDGRTLVSFEDVTERLKLDAELRETGARLQKIFQEVPTIAVQGYAPDGTVRYWNPASERLYGYPRDEAIGRNLVDLIIPEPMREVVRHAVRDMTAGGRGHPAEELLLRNKRGEPVPVYSSHVVVAVPGQETQLYCLDVDLAERKRTEAALLEREKLLSNIFDAASVAIFLVDRQGVITHANPRMAEMFACPLPDLVGSAYVAHLHPDEREVGRGRMLDLLASRIPSVDLERRFWREDGSEFWGHLVGRRFQGAHGEELGLIGVIADIDQRKRAAERYARMIETSMDGFVVVDRGGRITDCNDAVCALTGYAREEFLALTVAAFDGAEAPEAIARHLATTAQGGVERFETSWRRKDGSTFDAEVTTAFLPLSDEVCAFVRDITLSKQHQRELDHIAHYDALTGVPNRTLLADRMRQGVAQVRRAGTLMAFCYLDLDGFKPINDQYGHETGDRVLVEIAGRLEACLRGGDTVARMGGDEFVLLLLNLQQVAECEAALHRILDAVAQPMSVAGQPVGISASIGVAIYPHDDADVDTLLRHADQSMYLAKQSGKNRFHLFDPENDRQARDRSARLDRIGRAIGRREFVLHYQPQVNMRHGVVQGVEALIRWQHPERGLLPPAEFLPLIEDSDLIVDLGDWVIAEALAQIEAWQAAGVELSIGVNIAARQLLRTDFVARLGAQLAARPAVDPRRLNLEVLETAALEDIAHVSGVIAGCRELGIGFSLDDFGTGYSSLTYLKSLPAETLKIDQTFVRDMLVDLEDRAIVQGVIGLAKVFGREVIAEGVESVAHGTLLLELGCEQAQGYGIARPMAAEAVPDWVARWRPDPAWSPGAENLQKN